MSNKNKNKKKKNTKFDIKQFFIALIVTIILALLGYENIDFEELYNQNTSVISSTNNIAFDINSIPEYSGKPFVIINSNIPYFTQDDYTTEAFEKYSDFDNFGRCQVAFANICEEIMPDDNEKRGNIYYDPTGWAQESYNGEYLYNRCHLIGWQLANENNNKNNLITGTNYFNVDGMLTFENKVAQYMKKNENNHVLYRVTPIFEGTNKLASGVQMEAASVEDSGKELHFNVYVYNVQPGVVIDYATGKSRLAE